MILGQNVFGFKTSYADSMYTVAASQDPKAGLAFMLDNFYSVFIKDYDDGIQWATYAFDFSVKNKLRHEEGRANLSLGTIRYLKGEYEIAVVRFQNALDIFEELGDQCYIGRTCNEFSVYTRKQKQYEKALAYLDRSLQVCTECEDWTCVETSYNNRGVIYEMMGKYSASVSAYKKAESIAVANDNQIGLSYIYNNFAEVYRLKEQFDSMEFYVLKSTEIRIAMNDIQGVAINKTNLGDYFIQIKNGEKAKETLLEALELAREVNYPDLQQNIYGLLFKAEKMLGNFDKATDYLEAQLNLKDSLLNTDKIASLSEMEVRYETQKIEKEIAEERQVSTEAKLKVANRNNWIIIVSSTLGIGVLLGFILFQRRKRMAGEEKNRAVLLEKKRGLEAVFDATESERQRIAKDLHDGIGQQMSGLKLAWESLSYNIQSSDPKESARLLELTTILNEAADDLREISHQMMPKVLTEYGLIPAINEMLDKSLKFSNVKYEFEQFNIDDRFNARIELGIYRVCQELINNMMKHSGASLVSVQLFKNNKQLILIVEDNGSGFENEKTDGHGLLNIKSRLNTINGEVNYAGSQGSGTTATVRVDLTKN
jgi:signal transduction histidine kinase